MFFQWIPSLSWSKSQRTELSQQPSPHFIPTKSCLDYLSVWYLGTSRIQHKQRSHKQVHCTWSIHTCMPISMFRQAFRQPTNPTSSEHWFLNSWNWKKAGNIRMRIFIVPVSEWVNHHLFHSSRWNNHPRCGSYSASLLNQPTNQPF